jgi:hypothetical protein
MHAASTLLLVTSHIMAHFPIKVNIRNLHLLHLSDVLTFNQLHYTYPLRSGWHARLGQDGGEAQSTSLRPIVKQGWKKHGSRKNESGLPQSVYA